MSETRVCQLCPACKWDFVSRHQKCCPGCGTPLLIAYDVLSDEEPTALKSFWGDVQREVELHRGLESSETRSCGACC